MFTLYLVFEDGLVDEPLVVLQADSRAAARSQFTAIGIRVVPIHFSSYGRVLFFTQLLPYFS